MDKIDVALENLKKKKEQEKQYLAEFQDGDKIYRVFPSVSGRYITIEDLKYRVYIPPDINTEDLTIEKIKDLIKTAPNTHTLLIKKNPVKKPQSKL